MVAIIDRHTAMSTYLIAEQRWRSAIPLPGFVPLEDDCGSVADVVVEHGEVPMGLAEAEYRTRHLQVRRRDGLVLLRPPLGPRYLVGGGRIVVEAADDRDVALAGSALVSTLFGILCHQRGLLPLQANGVVVGDSAVLIAGASGVGKSTLAASLALEGFAPIADGVVPVDLDARQGPVALPTTERLRLWPETVAGLGLDEAAIDFPTEGTLRRSWDPGLKAGLGQRPVAALYVVLPQRRADPDLAQLSGSKKVGLVAEVSYRPLLQRALGSHPTGFPIQMALGRHVPIHYFALPSRYERLPDAYRLLYRHWETLGIL
ncbi:hypothetical protein T8K17_25570 (plasmid) [Thalassobaculum sp. OXR-137]|uniref:hypothetical protein n=1 Tax=Thalassobaculum sp. OXR-137 TaxID=3100173 RepID=UPI002AC951AF|nr:hypothetical protein [Thalassobaculum sp. OXR-137]WPZ37252.1 hypothetical protein T8K17_25570 [Thalassobaculum sp. OXR-137]